MYVMPSNFRYLCLSTQTIEWVWYQHYKIETFVCVFFYKYVAPSKLSKKKWNKNKAKIKTKGKGNEKLQV